MAEGRRRVREVCADGSCAFPWLTILLPGDNAKGRGSTAAGRLGGRRVGLLVVEGFFDCVRVYQSGFRNVVALMGCTISPPQIRQLHRACSSVVLLLDGDPAGRKGADAIARGLDGKVDVAIVQLPDGRHRTT
ncbi:MAG: toprim domain-containing protein [Acidobacteriota bacterium]